MAGKSKKPRVTLTTGIGTFSFPRVFRETAEKQKDGTLKYDIQFLIPKTDRETCRAIAAAVKEVGEDAFGANWKSARNPLRDGDAERKMLCEDGSTREEKYPERLGHYFINARSTKPVGVFDRERNLIVDSDRLYGGSKGRLSISFFSYNREGNAGIGVGLEGVQFIADGEPLGGGGPASPASMFGEMSDDEIDAMLDGGDPDTDEEPEEKPKKKKKAKK